MNLGKNILELRKQKNVTQDEMAAELGVTAAAVSKWENNYTLPDILMLCALADYFGVTTDELLGRSAARKHAIVVAQTEELGQKIADLVNEYDIQVNVILTSYEVALAVLQFEAEHNSEVRYLFTAMNGPLTEQEEQELDHFHDITHIDVRTTGGADEDALNGIELYLKNMGAFHSLSTHKVHATKIVK